MTRAAKLLRLSRRKTGYGWGNLRAWLRFKGCS